MMISAEVCEFNLAWTSIPYHGRDSQITENVFIYRLLDVFVLVALLYNNLINHFITQHHSNQFDISLINYDIPLNPPN